MGSPMVLRMILLFSFLVIVECKNKPIFPVACQLNILIILDRSDSVQGGFDISRSFVRDIAQDLQIGPGHHEVALMAYSGKYAKIDTQSWNFAKNNTDFIRKLNALRNVGGTTYTGRALIEAKNVLEKRNKNYETVIMLVTDGNSADDIFAPAAEIRNQNDIYFFVAAAIEVKGAYKKNLARIAGDQNHVVATQGRQKASEVARTILKDAQRKCATTTSTTTTTTTTTTTNPTTGCEMDLVLVLDFSTTTSPLYEHYKTMSSQLVKSLIISPHHTKVSCVTFSSKGWTITQFNLRRYKTQDEVVGAIESLKTNGGTTNVGEGMLMAMNQSLEREGARPDIATKVMVVFTDGWNNKGPDPKETAKKAAGLGFEMYAVGVSEGDPKENLELKMDTLENIAENTDHVFTDKTFDKLIDKVKQRNAPCVNGGVAKEKGKNGGKATTKKPPVNRGRGKRETSWIQYLLSFY